MANDTHANILLNLIMRKYGCLPDEYRIVGFDDSPIASEAIIPISTIGQQIDKRNITLKNHGRAHNPLYHGFLQIYLLFLIFVSSRQTYKYTYHHSGCKQNYHPHNWRCCIASLGAFQS